MPAADAPACVAPREALRADRPRRATGRSASGLLLWAAAARRTAAGSSRHECPITLPSLGPWKPCRERNSSNVIRRCPNDHTSSANSVSITPPYPANSAGTRSLRPALTEIDSTCARNTLRMSRVRTCTRIAALNRSDESVSRVRGSRHRPFSTTARHQVICRWCRRRGADRSRASTNGALTTTAGNRRGSLRVGVASARTAPNKSRSKSSPVIPGSNPASSRARSTFIACLPKKQAVLH
jgi:hypothetical protein